MKRALLIVFLFAFRSAYSQADSAFFYSSGTFVVPANVNSLTIEVIGSGGSGGADGGGGGGGGGYAKGIYAVNPGDSLNVIVGNGNSSPTSVASLISATGGATGYTSGGGGTGGSGIGGTITNRNGGNGGAGASGQAGGGGGGAAGSLSNGYSGMNSPTGVCIQTGGTGGVGGGTPAGQGGNGAGYDYFVCSAPDNATYAQFYGGGGGGGGNSNSPTAGAPGWCKIWWVKPIGIEELSPVAFRLFPNPAHETFSIFFPNQISTFETQISIFDVTGTKVYEQQIRCSVGEADEPLSPGNRQLKPGLYLVKINAGDRVYSQRIIIE